MRILCLHGVGGQSARDAWRSEWKQAVRTGLRHAGWSQPTDFAFWDYDERFFRRGTPGVGDSVIAVGKLLGSGAGSLARWMVGEEGIFDGAKTMIRQTAGMVVQWVEDERLREELLEALIDRIERDRPDVILAHSLGSLIAYDVLSHPDGKKSFRGGTFVSFGSQIGHPFVVGNLFAGRIVPLEQISWFHLFNKFDDVFTSSIRLASPWYTQIETPFGEWGSLDHDAVKYLAHEQSRLRLWPGVCDLTDSPAKLEEAVVKQREPRSKALLVGIGEYPDPRQRLDGCVNDVFLISSVLQEGRFRPDDIRLLVDSRATTAAILERLHWLLDGALPGDRLVFHFSGHGVALPGYRAGQVVDRIHECLVPYDFDGSLDRTIADEAIYNMYANLHYGVHFAMVFDCCHSGGQGRGGVGRVRGIEPPADIRHRALRWDADRGLWVARTLPPLHPGLAAGSERVTRFAGANGGTMRLGRAMAVRSLETSEASRRRTQREHLGPYMPLILQACSPDESAHEYHHGGVSYGASTFMLAQEFRRLRKENGQRATVRLLVDRTGTTIREELSLPQTAYVEGPEEVMDVFGLFDS